MSNSKLVWHGTVIAVQPRIRLARSFDQRYHTYLGYMLRLQGQIGKDEGEFLVGIGQAAQAKHRFQVGDRVSGRSEPVVHPEREPVGYYKTASLKVSQRASASEQRPPPWHGVPPEVVFPLRGFCPGRLYRSSHSRTDGP